MPGDGRVPERQVSSHAPPVLPGSAKPGAPALAGRRGNCSAWVAGRRAQAPAWRSWPALLSFSRAGGSHRDVWPVPVPARTKR